VHVDVQAHDGVVSLSGPIVESALPMVLRAVRFVRGVKEVNNQMNVQKDAEELPAMPSTEPLGASPI